MFEHTHRHKSFFYSQRDENNCSLTTKYNLHFLTNQGVDFLKVSLVQFLLTESQEAKKGRETERGDTPVHTTYRRKQIQHVIDYIHVCKNEIAKSDSVATNEIHHTDQML